MRLLTLTLIVLSFSSCVSYQYVTLGSPEVSKNDKKTFSWENDTLRLDYDYSGRGGPFWISVYNKTDKPLYINWKKSAIIKGTYANSLFDPSVQVSGSFNANRGFTTTSGNMAGSFDMPAGTDFIPPGS